MFATHPRALVTSGQRAGRWKDTPQAVKGVRGRVLLADDHPLLRQTLHQLLAGELDIEVVGEAANGRETGELPRALQPTLVVRDSGTPVLNGSQAPRAIQAECPGAYVIALSRIAPAEQAAAGSSQRPASHPVPSCRAACLRA